MFPFRFGIGLSPSYANPSFRELFDPEGFQAPFGPTTLERRNEYYMATKPTSYCCYWNGQSWPYSTSHVLKSLAAAHRVGSLSTTAEQYYQYLSIYATTQHDSYGRPFVAEAHYPEIDAWSAYESNHSEHYDHSRYNDDVITGLLGLVPRSDNMLQISPIVPQNWTYFAIENVAYHGHLVTYLYDSDGSRYNNGGGLSIFVDGQKIHNSSERSAMVSLPSNGTHNSETATPVNIAANPYGLGYFPNATATNTFEHDSIWKPIDGFVFYDFMPDNRWTNNQSWSPNDTYGITFARPRTFSSVTLAIYADRTDGGAVDCPRAVEIWGDHGVLANISDFGAICKPNDRNTIQLGRNVTSLSVSANMFIKRGYAVGLAEFEVWVPPNRGPLYYAVDAFLVNANVTFDARSHATANGAVIGNNSVHAKVVFSGVYAEKAGPVTLQVSYANKANRPVEMGVDINRFAAGNMTLAPRGPDYQAVTLDTELEAGNNFVTLTGGNHYIFFETMRVTARS